jgi:Bacterial Ig domain
LRSHRESFMKHVRRLVAVLPVALLFVVPTLAQTSSPVIVSSLGYLNGTPLTAHRSTAFNSTGASTLVAFVSTNTPWNGLPVSINGVSDNLGNTWNMLTGPTVFSGSTWTLLSGIYYVNNPATSANQTVTVQLSNAAPLVFHVFAVSGSDLTGPPIVSPITDPGTGATSANVASAPITVPNNSLLLSWVKNETGANATAVNGYSLDSQSTSYLWAESQTAISSGSYSGAFQYDSTIGWQTAIVGLKPSTGPVASNQTVVTQQDTPVNITLTAISPQGYPLTYTVLTQPIHGTLSGSAHDLTYTPNAGYIGPDSFTFRANDGTSNSNTATVSITVRGLAPVINSTVGYINGTPLTAHTSNPFNSVGASTLVAFVSSHPSWNNLPVSISGLTDNIGNTWKLLTGPTQFPGSSFTLLSSIYYVNSPVTSTTHTVTAQLTNPAPLVLHVFAVSQSDVTGASIFSPITDPGPGGTSATVTSAPITIPTNSLLLSWVKNESGATATAVNGYTLDLQSTSYLWAESQTPISAGSYTGNFQYNSAIGWQTAIVGVKPRTTGPPSPVITSMPANPTNQTSASFSFTDTQTGVTFLCQLDGNGFSTCSSPATYSGLSQGSHTFSVKAQDASGNQSGPTNFTWTVDTTAPPTPVITSSPANPTTQTSASFSFSDTEAGVTFLCQLDNGAFTACASPATYSGLSQGTHTFSVQAQDAAGNQSSAANFSWTINGTAPPTPTLTSTPSNPSNQTSASFGFSDSQAGVSFLCQLDNGAFTACASPATYSGLNQGSHTFSVKAQDSNGNQSGAASFTWTVDTTAPPIPVITSTPANPTNQTSASFGFSDTEAGVSFLCQLDGSAFSACSNPKAYSGLNQGSHTFFVTAQDAAGNQSGAASFTWTIDTTAPPKPVITSGPANPTNQTSASFSFTDAQAGVIFLCQLDNSAFSVCSSPVLYPGPLSKGKHSFSLRAQDAAGNLSGSVNFRWTII